jgi:hypothetical protein
MRADKLKRHEKPGLEARLRSVRLALRYHAADQGERR